MTYVAQAPSGKATTRPQRRCFRNTRLDLQEIVGDDGWTQDVWELSPGSVDDSSRRFYKSFSREKI